MPDQISESLEDEKMFACAAGDAATVLFLETLSTLLIAAFACPQACATLDARMLFSVLLLLGCHGTARGWPITLGDADGGGRAAALTRE